MNLKNKNNTVKVKASTGKKVGNRTVIGIVCILVAFAVCFGIIPLLNRSSAEHVEIVRIKQTVTKGSMIGEGDIEIVSVGVYNLPDAVIRSKDEVIGKYARGDIYPGEYLLPSKLTTDIGTATDIMESLNQGYYLDHFLRSGQSGYQRHGAAGNGNASCQPNAGGAFSAV